MADKVRPAHQSGPCDMTSFLFFFLFTYTTMTSLFTFNCDNVKALWCNFIDPIHSKVDQLGDGVSPCAVLDGRGRDILFMTDIAAL